MVEMFVLAALSFAAFLVVAVLISVFSLVGRFLWLPFKIFGWFMRIVGLVIALPFILIALLLGGFGVLLGMGFMLIPLFPLLLVGAVFWWIFRDRRRPESQARVVG